MRLKVKDAAQNTIELTVEETVELNRLWSIYDRNIVEYNKHTPNSGAAASRMYAEHRSLFSSFEEELGEVYNTVITLI